VNGQPYATAILSLGKGSPISTEEEAGCFPEPVWMLWRKEKYLASVMN
jgi:hypothetical protein